MRESIETRLRDENEMLREQVRQLREAMAPSDFPLPEGLHLTPTERALLSHLSSRNVATHESLFMVLYSDRTDDGPGGNNVPVHIARLRQKIVPFGASIINVRGVGFRLTGWSLKTGGRRE